MFAADPGSRTTNYKDYQNTCTDFITEISNDYTEWVDRYQLSNEETNRRKAAIHNVVRTTNEWINKFGTTIKKIDIIMNDGVNKMAESTAGYPFKYDVFVNNASHYATHPVGLVRINLKAMPRQGRLMRIGNYHKDQLFLISSSSLVNFSLSKDSMTAADVLDDYIIIDAKNCQKHDVISITTVVEEVENDYVTESRGYSTLILLT